MKRFIEIACEQLFGCFFIDCLSITQNGPHNHNLFHLLVLFLVFKGSNIIATANTDSKLIISLESWDFVYIHSLYIVIAALRDKTFENALRLEQTYV